MVRTEKTEYYDAFGNKHTVSHKIETPQQPFGNLSWGNPPYLPIQQPWLWQPPLEDRREIHPQIPPTVPCSIEEIVFE